MKITTLTVGSLQTNCYLLTDNQNNCLIVDPGDEADFITTTIQESKLKPKSILLTHGHYDHCLGCLEIALNFNIPTYLHQDDLFIYQKAHSSAKHFSSISIPPLPKISHLIQGNQILNIENFTIQIIHTPGHTPGSCCFLINNKYLFTGDMLFSGNRVGSTQHQYSSKTDLQHSIEKLKSKIYDLKSTIYIYPGHEDYGFSIN